MYIKGFFTANAETLARLAEIGVVLQYDRQSGGYDSITIPAAFAPEFIHVHGNVSVCGTLSLAYDHTNRPRQVRPC